jgi:outer membrane lipoprotein carrier protein
MRDALWAIVAFLVSLSIAYAEITTTDLVAKIQERYNGTQTLRADFVQKTHSQAVGLGTSAKGTLYLRRPKAMRWEYEEPRQWFLVLEDKTWHYSPEDMTIYEQDIRLPEIFNLFTGLDRAKKAFEIARLPDTVGSPAHHRLELLPRNPDFPVSRVELRIDPQSYLVVGVQTEDSLGNINEISLNHIQLDSILEPSLFQLKLPEGVRLERLTTSTP